jgi:hypothetical protein
VQPHYNVRQVTTEEREHELANYANTLAQIFLLFTYNITAAARSQNGRKKLIQNLEYGHNLDLLVWNG